MENPIILDPAARKFWRKYMERDKKVDVYFLWESLSQEFGHMMTRVDELEAERAFIGAIDKNRNESITNMEFNNWTRKHGLKTALEQILHTLETKVVWHDDRNGQWGESDAAVAFKKADGSFRDQERREKRESRDKRHAENRRGQQGGSRGEYQRGSPPQSSPKLSPKGSPGRSMQNKNNVDLDDDDGDIRRRRQRQIPQASLKVQDPVEGTLVGEDDFNSVLAERIAAEEEEMKQAEVRRARQRDMDRTRNKREREAVRQEQEADMLSARQRMLQRQEDEDTIRREEAEAEARAARWAEADAEIKLHRQLRTARAEELDKQMRFDDELRFSCLTLKGHESYITGISFCGERLVSSSADKTIKVWDVEKQKVKKTLNGHTTRINAVASDNKSIISGSRDGTVHIWDVRTGEITDTEPSDKVAISCLSMGSVPRHAMLGRQDGEIRLLDLRSPITVVRTFLGHKGNVTGLDFNGDMLASSSSDGTARVWDFGTGTCIHTLKGHYSDVSSVKLDDNKVVTGSYDETIRYWELSSGKCRQKTMFPLGMVSSVCLDGDELVAGSYCNKVIPMV